MIYLYVDLIVNVFVGIFGLVLIVEVILVGKRVVFVNKEIFVIGGKIIKRIIF